MVILALDRFELLYGSGVSKDTLSKNTNLTTEQIDLLYNASVKQNPLRYVQLEVIENLGRYPKLTEEQFMRYYNEADFLDLKYLSRNPHLTTEQIDLLYETEGESKEKISRFPKLTDNHFLRFYYDKGKTIINSLALNPSINPAKQPFVSGIFNWKW